MSGLEGLAALGLACNIFQVIDFAKSTITIVKDIHKGRPPDAQLQNDVDKLAELLRELNPQTTENQDQDDDERQLLDAALQCKSAGEVLRAKAIKLEKRRMGTLLAVAHAFKQRRHEDELNKLKAKFEDASRIMVAGLAVRIYNKHVEAEDKFKELEAKLRKLIVEKRADHQEQMKHVEIEGVKTRDHITAKTHEMNSEIKALADGRESQRKRERFIKSFKFSGINERFHGASEPHEKTFEWVFEDESQSSDQDKQKTLGWDRFATWLESDTDIYWISGKPGSGKTTLMKYLLSCPGTTTCLEKWAKNVGEKSVVIISHFIWRLGSTIQRSMKGLLCSLIYNLLKIDESAFDQVFAKYDDGDKDSEKDWSIAELKRMCLDLIQHCSRPICIFVDALDEIDQDDGYDSLFQLLNEISSYRTTKLCVSGRPEPAIQRRLSAASCLRLQDLTRKDIFKYVEDNLCNPKYDLPSAPRAPWATWAPDPTLIEKIVDKAEGVFLWVHITVNSLKEGLGNEDNFQTLEQRIENLPSKLEDLYNDMWSRLNGNQQVYRETAALYFHVALAHAGRPFRLESDVMEDTLTPLRMSLATNRPLLDKFRDGKGDDTTSTKEILETCNEVMKNVRIRTAGLLQLAERGVKKSTVNTGGRFDALFPYADGHFSFHFIHRTVSDFLQDTVDGQRVLSHSRSSSTEIMSGIVEAGLALCQLFNTSRGGFNAFHSVATIHSYTWDVVGLISRGSLPRTQSSEAYRILELCSVLCQRNRMRYNKDEMCTFELFLLSTLFNGLGFYVISLLERRPLPENLKSQLLWSVSLDKDPDAHCLYERLLDKKADPNWTYEAPWYIQKYEVLETPFIRLLIGAFRYFDQPGADPASLRRYLQSIDKFLTKGAEPSQVVILGLGNMHGPETTGRLVDRWTERFEMAWLPSLCIKFTATNLILLLLEIVARVSRLWTGDTDRELTALVETIRSKCEQHRPVDEGCRVLAVLEKTNRKLRMGLRSVTINRGIPRETTKDQSETMIETLRSVLVNGSSNSEIERLSALSHKVYEDSGAQSEKEVLLAIKEGGGMLSDYGKAELRNNLKEINFRF